MIIGHEIVPDIEDDGMKRLLNFADQTLAGEMHPEARKWFLSGSGPQLAKIYNLGNTSPGANRRGNSMQDLYLSCLGWFLGQEIRNGKFKTNEEVAYWLTLNLLDGPEMLRRGAR